MSGLRSTKAEFTGRIAAGAIGGRAIDRDLIEKVRVAILIARLRRKINGPSVRADPGPNLRVGMIGRAESDIFDRLSARCRRFQ